MLCSQEPGRSPGASKQRLAGALNDEYWENWATNPYRVEMGSFISHQKGRKVAEEMDVTEKKKVELVPNIPPVLNVLYSQGPGRRP